MKQKTEIFIETPTINLAQLLKMAGLAENGGQAKHLVREGLVKVNEKTCLQPGKQLAPGDVILLGEEELCIFWKK